jgi:hypothetical protein
MDVSKASDDIQIFRGTKCIDVLSCGQEEPFTLEEISELIKAHAFKGKQLILAQVTTKVSNDEVRYFYYLASALNKLIFRSFGKEQEYLFRLRMLNPMTNTEMIGDVNYFMVSFDTPPSNDAPRRVTIGQFPSIKDLTKSTPEVAEFVSPDRRGSSVKLNTLLPTRTSTKKNTKSLPHLSQDIPEENRSIHHKEKSEAQLDKIEELKPFGSISILKANLGVYHNTLRRKSEEMTKGITFKYNLNLDSLKSIQHLQEKVMGIQSEPR